MSTPDNNLLKWTLKISAIIVSLTILIAGYFYWEAYQLMKDWEAKKIQTALERASSTPEISVSPDSTSHCLIASISRPTQPHTHLPRDSCLKVAKFVVLNNRELYTT